MHNRLQVGIDFSQKRADFCLLFPEGQPLESHVAFDNSYLGYSGAKQLLLDALDDNAFDGIDVSGEATGYLWLPFFLQLAADPELKLHDLRLHLLNPRWVKWFKKCFAEDHKCDAKDAFYIAERTRTRRPDNPWVPPECLALRFHIVQNLAREKCYFSTFLFLKASAYRRMQPFSNVFGVTSGLILTQQPSLDDLAALPVQDLATQLYDLSDHHLPDPLENARKLGKSGRPVWVRTPIIPGHTDTIENVRAVARFVAQEMPDAERYDLLAFNNLCSAQYERLGMEFPLKEAELVRKEEMEAFKAAAVEEGAPNVHWSGATRLEEE